MNLTAADENELWLRSSVSDLETASAMMQPRTRFLRLLTIYYGLLQSVHLVVLGYGMTVYLQHQVIGFPAPPPSIPWQRQAINFSLGNGMLDAVVAVAGLFYVFGFLQGKNWGRVLGLVCVTASLSSGVFFVIGTALSGAWVADPLHYSGLVLIFSPLVPLFFLLFRDLLHHSSQAPSMSDLE